MIEHADNGWIIRCKHFYKEKGKLKEDEDETVLVGKEDEMDETNAFKEFLWDILSNFGPSSSRYDEKRIHIITMPGDKFTGSLSEEYKEELKELRDELTYYIEEQDNAE